MRYDTGSRAQLTALGATEILRSRKDPIYNKPATHTCTRVCIVRRKHSHHPPQDAGSDAMSPWKSRTRGWRWLFSPAPLRASAARGIKAPPFHLPEQPSVCPVSRLEPGGDATCPQSLHTPGDVGIRRCIPQALLHHSNSCEARQLKAPLGARSAPRWFNARAASKKRS